MNAVSNATPDVRPLPDEIPTLTQEIDEVSPLVECALDARAAEKQAFMALSAELLQQLRPEFDRLAAGLVHRTLETAWHHKANTTKKP
jgi:hypothetical protein